MQRDLNDWLIYLESTHPKLMDLGLDRVAAVARQLNVLNFSCPVVTVAGTNGKGSCVACIESSARMAGYSVGSYTSPHLLFYNERIRINGTCVTDEALCFAFSEIETARGDVSLTYFEWSTLAALYLFRQANLDLVILEVGLGGRLDAVNSVDADIAVISTIALDHTEWLGDNREKIGFEKAGIMRAGRPCVCGDFDVPQSIRQQAASLNAPLFCQGEDFGFIDAIPKGFQDLGRRASVSTRGVYKDIHEHVHSEAQHRQILKGEGYKMHWAFWSQTLQFENLPVPTLALQNVATALQVLALLSSKLKVSRLAIEDALQQLALPGRFQSLPGGKIQTWLDVAHNPAAGTFLAKQLGAVNCSGRKLAVVGMLAHKDTANTLAPLIGQINHWYLAPCSVASSGAYGMQSSRAEVLAQQLSQLQVQADDITISCSVKKAYQQALEASEMGDHLVVFGSFYTVAEVLRLKL